MSRTSTVLRRAVLGAVLAALAAGGGATAAQAAPDAPGAPGGVTSTTAQGSWVPGILTSRRDVDTYRFTTASGGHARILLGDLAADYRLRLLDESGRVVATSDRRGRRANEEIYRHLPAGTWFASVSASRGTVSRAPYVVRFGSLSEGVHVLSRTVQNLSVTKHPSGRRFVFEVLNNTPHTIDGIGWAVRTPCAVPSCYSYEYMLPRAVPSRGRTVLTHWDGLPKRGEVLTVLAGASIDHLPKLTVKPGFNGLRDRYMDYHSPRVTNRGSRVATCVSVHRNAYDDRGDLVQHQSLSTGPARVRPGATWARPEHATGFYFPPASAARTVWGADDRGPSPYPC